MMTWTCAGFKGHWPVGTAATVTADNVQLACELLEKELDRVGLPRMLP